MDLDSVECVSSCDGMDEDEPSHLHHQFVKPHGGAVFNGATTVPGISPTTSINELLECPVCTNSMYPPIHQGLVPSMLYCAPVLFVYIG